MLYLGRLADLLHWCCPSLLVEVVEELHPLLFDDHWKARFGLDDTSSVRLAATVMVRRFSFSELAEQSQAVSRCDRAQVKMKLNLYLPDGHDNRINQGTIEEQLGHYLGNNLSTFYEYSDGSLCPTLPAPVPRVHLSREGMCLRTNPYCAKRLYLA